MILVPNRIIKESICYSESIKGLSWFEEVFFYRLIVNADDYGRLDGRMELLQARLFPLRRDITDKAMEKALNALTTVGMVRPYMVEQKPYLQLTAWERHQQVRATKSKYPNPPELDINCNQPQPDVPVIECVSESDDMHEAETASCPPVAELILNDKTMYPVHQVQVDKWASLYPAVDITSEVRKMVGWCDANPRKRKTKSGIERFITSWLAKEQDKGGVAGQKSEWREL